MKIGYKSQPSGSRICGQTVLAMILNKNIEDICKIIGNTGTRNPDIKHVLEEFNIEYRYKKTSKFENLTANLAIVKIGFIDSPTTHWTLKVKDKFYDPSIGIVEMYSENIELMSYIEILSEENSQKVK